MRNKSNSKLPLIITLSLVGAAVVGTVFLAITNHNAKENYLENIEYPDVEAFFEERGEIITVTPVKNSKNTLSEEDVVTELRDRGFIDYPVTADYSIDGAFDAPVDASEDSDSLHPMYKTYYIDSEGSMWSISVVDGRFTAYPSTYNLEHSGNVPIELSETEEIASYDNSTNSIYLTLPYESILDVRVVDRIDASTIESIELEG